MRSNRLILAALLVAATAPVAADCLHPRPAADDGMGGIMVGAERNLHVVFFDPDHASAGPLIRESLAYACARGGFRLVPIDGPGAPATNHPRSSAETLHCASRMDAGEVLAALTGARSIPWLDTILGPDAGPGRCGAAEVRLALETLAALGVTAGGDQVVIVSSSGAVFVGRRSEAERWLADSLAVAPH